MQMTALVAATTANVLDKTEKMLVSLAACRDRFDLLVMSLCHHMSPAYDGNGTCGLFLLHSPHDDGVQNAQQAGQYVGVILCHEAQTRSSPCTRSDWRRLMRCR